jgi:hypothetical protein
MILVLVLAACNKADTEVVVGQPELADPPATIDFGQVQVGKAVTASVDFTNDGIGGLTWTGEFVGAGDIRLIAVPDEVAPHETAQIELAFSPSVEGPAEGLLILDTNDADYAHLEIPVQGTGVIPHLVVSPDALYFGTVGEGEAVTRPTTLSSTGSGPVVITALAFPNGEDVAYSWALPDDATLPYTLEPGHAIAMSVTYAPPDATQVSGDLVIASNDQLMPAMTIHLLGGESQGGSRPPQVEIVEPQWGVRRIEGESVDVKVHAVDEDDAPSDLLVVLYDNGALVGTASPDSEGWYATTLGGLSPGDHRLVATAIDPDSNIDQDDVTVGVDTEDDLHWTLTGGESVFEYWSVDDDVRVDVNGVTVFSDANGHQSTNPPIPFEAAAGGELHVVATDAAQCRKMIDDLWLHFGTDRHVQLSVAESSSACPQDPDYDTGYDGPWPNDFFDETFTLEVP